MSLLTSLNTAMTTVNNVVMGTKNIKHVHKHYIKPQIQHMKRAGAKLKAKTKRSHQKKHK